MYGCRTLALGIASGGGSLQTERGRCHNCCDNDNNGECDAESCVEVEVLFWDEFRGLYLFVSDACLVGQHVGCCSHAGKLAKAVRCRDSCSWRGSSLNDPAVVLQDVRSSRRMRWPVPAVAGQARQGTWSCTRYSVACVKIGQGLAALTRWNRGKGNRGNRERGSNRIKARTLQSRRLCFVGLNNNGA